MSLTFRSLKCRTNLFVKFVVVADLNNKNWIYNIVFAAQQKTLILVVDDDFCWLVVEFVVVDLPCMTTPPNSCCVVVLLLTPFSHNTFLQL